MRVRRSAYEPHRCGRWGAGGTQPNGARPSQGEEIAALRLKLASLESLQEQDTTRICLDIAYDRQRIAKLEKSTPGPTDEERIGKLEGYLKDKKSAGLRPEASFTEARAYLEVSRSQFSQLISKLDPRDFVISPNPLNYKSKLIGLSHKM